MDKNLFEELVTIPGISGREERIRDFVKTRLEPLVDEVSVDRLGSVIGIKRGSGPKVMLSAHMDTIGFLVKHVDDSGFISISPVGGFDPRTLAVQRVLVCGKQDYVGLLSWKTKPVHVLTDEEKKKPPSIDDLFVDIVAEPDEVKENVHVGDPVVLRRTPVVTEDVVTAPYLDDRLGVYVLLEALKKAGDVEAEVHAVISVQEEVGLRGARTSAYSTDPDIGIALDITLATDTPGVEPAARVAEFRKGVAIGVMDGSMIADPRLVEHFRELAEERDIPYQVEILPRGGTDAGAMQMVRAGVSVITISVPVRYVHTTNESAAVPDIEANVDLMAAFLEGAHKLSIEW
jgi:putative aminopeptidase FrvX